jgi:hypothetical protein
LSSAIALRRYDSGPVIPYCLGRSANRRVRVTVSKAIRRRPSTIAEAARLDHYAILPTLRMTASRDLKIRWFDDTDVASAFARSQFFRVKRTGHVRFLNLLVVLMALPFHVVSAALVLLCWSQSPRCGWSHACWVDRIKQSLTGPLGTRHVRLDGCHDLLRTSPSRRSTTGVPIRDGGASSTTGRRFCISGLSGWTIVRLLLRTICPSRSRA